MILPSYRLRRRFSNRSSMSKIVCGKRILPIVNSVYKFSKLSDRHLFHTKPHEVHWQTSNFQNPFQVQGELYTSPSFIDAHREVQELPGEPACNLPRVIAALMFWSDATRLTSFGKAKLWPLYLFFGNDSKYRRCKPSCHLCEHVAYFQTVNPI
jgi:Plavaka transposase